MWNKSLKTGVVFGLALSISACSTKEEKSASVEPAVKEDVVKPAAPPSSAPTSSPTSSPSSAPTSSVDCSPLSELAAMDHRKPVPLQPMMAWHQKQNMMEHLVAIQGITAALAKEDWEGIAKASAAIESSPQMAQMCQHMGSGAAGFTELALDFHKRADAIAIAAKKKDSKGVLKATAHTLQACTSCHATYKQEVLSASDWEAKTGSDHQPGMGH